MWWSLSRHNPCVFSASQNSCLNDNRKKEELRFYVLMQQQGYAVAFGPVTFIELGTEKGEEVVIWVL